MICTIYNLYCLYSIVSFEDSQYEVVALTPEKVLELIEQAYPNPVSPEDLARYRTLPSSKSGYKMY